MLGGEIAEHFRAFAVEAHGHAVTLVVVERIGRGHAVAGQIGALFDQELHGLFLALDDVLVFFDHVARRQHRLAGVDLREDRVALRMNKGELQLGHALELFLGLRELLRVEPGNLHEDAVAALRGDDRFAHAELVHAFADDLDRLIQGGRRDFLTVFAYQAQEEGCSALQVEAEAGFFLGRNDGLETESHQQQGQHQPDGALASRRIGHEIPGEQSEEEKAEEESDGRAHRLGRCDWRRIRRLPPCSRWRWRSCRSRASRCPPP